MRMKNTKNKPAIASPSFDGPQEYMLIRDIADIIGYSCTHKLSKQAMAMGIEVFHIFPSEPPRRLVLAVRKEDGLKLIRATRPAKVVPKEEILKMLKEGQ